MLKQDSNPSTGVKKYVIFKLSLYSICVVGKSKEPKRFGVVAVVCLIAGLVVGVAIGVIAVFVVQKYAKR